MRVGVAGALGRLGRVASAAISAADDLDLVAAFGRSSAGGRLGDLIGCGGDVRVDDTLEAFYARRPEITRVVDISGVVDQKVEANRCNVAKGPAGHHGSMLRAELAQKHERLPLLGDDDVTADRNYIKEFVLARNRELGRKYGVEYAEAFHYIGPAAPSPVEDYVQKHAKRVR